MSKDKDKRILDSDADGLSDQQEKNMGTNPHNPDTDNDDLGDYQEVKIYKTDPLDPDSDCDDIGDGTEVKMGRNPKGKGSLRDLFLPSQCNDYKPHILHPRRLAFHALSAVAVKVIVAAFILSFPVQAWLSPDVLYQEAQKIVDLTNNIRINLNLNPLSENESLRQAALAKSEDMLIKEYFAHVGPDERSLKDWLYGVEYPFSVAGENLAIGFSNPQEVVNAWTESPTHYANIIDPDFTEIGVGAVSGTYEGHETTLIAQYFGHRVTAAVVPEPEKMPLKPDDYNNKIEEAAVEVENETEEPIDEPELEEIIEPELEPEPEIVPEPVENNYILPAPELMLSQEELNTKENINILHINAPAASLVTVLDSGQNIAAQEKLPDTDFVDITVELDKGTHHLQIVSGYEENNSVSKVYLLKIDQAGPAIDHDKTKILVNQPAGNEDIVLQATAYLSDDTVTAQVSFAENNIILSKDESEEGKWTGSQVISGVDYDNLFNPVVMASLTAVDQAGNTIIQDISWENVQPVEGSVLGQYTFLRQNSSEFVKPLFNLSSIYYKILLVISIIALMLNIFVEVKKQHPRTIASTLALILLVSFLTIF